MDFSQVQGILIISVILSICALTEQYSFVFHTTTPKPNFRTDCTEDGLLLIKGDVISIAEVIKTVECWREANQINIFALNKVIFDDDIDKRDVSTANVAIFAPTWEIIPPSSSSPAMENQTQRRIRVNADSEFNFYGVCIEKINGKELEFSVDGDKNRIKMIFNNDPSIEEISSLKPTAIFMSSFNEVPTLKAYRHYARTNFEQTTNHSNLWKFLIELKTQYTFADLNELNDDFLCLEDKFSDLRKNTDVTPMYQSLRDQLEHPKQQLEGHERLRNLLQSALISKILAIRNHTTITDYVQMDGIPMLEFRLKYRHDVIRNHEEIMDYHVNYRRESTKWASELTEINTALMDKMYNETVRNVKDPVEDVIIRHQMELPLKTIQLLLSTITKDRHLLIQDVKQSFLSKFFEKFQNRLTLLEEVLQNFVDTLNQNQTSDVFYDIERTVADLLDEINETSEQNDQNRTDNLLNVLFNAWPELTNMIDNTKSHMELQMNQNGNRNVVAAIEQLNRMQGLMKCSEMGIKTYRDCRNDLTKLMSFVQQFDESFQKHQLLLEKWKEFEKSFYKIMLNLFKQTGTDEILPHLYELNGIFGKMQHRSLKYSNDIKRVIQDTNQVIKLTIDVYHNMQGTEDRRKLLDQLKSRSNEQIDSETQSKMDILNEIIKSNFILEMCLTSAFQVLKMRVFPFDQERLILCDLPINTNATWNSTSVRQILLKNIEKFESGKDAHKSNVQQNLEDSVSHANETQTLYEWKHEDFKHEISRLLNGEEIMLNADIANSIDHHGVKFNKVWLEFDFAKKSSKKQFDELLDGHSVKLQTMGNNYYRCENRYYYVPNGNVDFFEYQINDTDHNNIYYKISEKDAFLSPYTIWKIQLIIRWEYIRSNPNKFVGNKINLKLVGKASYVSSHFYDFIPNMCMNDELNKNYLLDRVDDGPVTRW